jgi:ankyrin repeat protein
VSGGRVDAVALLLKLGADPYAIDKQGNTPDLALSAGVSSDAAADIQKLFDQCDEALQPVLPPGAS